ncbi:MAG TPA: polysaccharide biosynthesis C-terminal domain-containing protein, partial [Saprospiraceae bacterium]|nr:polysaccharide biosynthesis C-terminal domain-containing protein [Saprospiraceae bacterium]
MSLVKQITILTNDEVRMMQWFMLCRLSGVLLSSIVVARTLPIAEVGTMEMLLFCGYLMTFFWSDAFLKGFLAKKGMAPGELNPATFFLIYFLLGLAAMALLLAAQSWLVPLFTGRKVLQGLPLYALYQALIIPVWMSPFIQVLRKNIVPLLALFVLIGPSFAVWAGNQSLPGLNGILIGLLSYALVGFIWMLTQIRFSKTLWISSFLKWIWPVTWPLILYSVSTAIAKSVDAWLVAHYFDASTFAIFRYGAREFPLVVALSSGLSTSMIPRLVNPEAIHELQSRSTRLMHLCYPLIAALMIMSPPLFRIFFGDAYQASALIFNIYLLLTLTQLIFPQTILMAKGQTQWLWWISIIELLFNIGASLAFMVSFGYIGIVWGTLVAYVVEKIILLLVVYKKYELSPAAFVQVRTWIAYSVLVMAAFLVS